MGYLFAGAVHLQISLGKYLYLQTGLLANRSLVAVVYLHRWLQYRAIASCFWGRLGHYQGHRSTFAAYALCRLNTLLSATLGVILILGLS